jgi:type IX secretion system PorP/SprF family membrane protein
MKVLLSVLLFFHIYFVSFSQQEPVFSLNETNQSYYNPSSTAVYDKHLLNTQYRNQWIVFNGSPITYLLNYEMDIAKINSGLGLVAMRDEVGLNTNHTIGLNYRYTFKLGELSRLSAGIGVNWFHQRISNGWITPSTTNDQYLPYPHNSTNSTFNLNSGLHFQRKQFNIGLGVMNVISIFRNNSPYFPYHRALHTNLFADYTFDISDNFSLTPSTFIITDWVRLSSLISIKGMHYNRFWWLAGYRTKGQALTIGAGIQFWERLQIGFAYEYSIEKHYAGFNHSLECNLVFRIKK